MLIRFTVENYKSFDKEAVFSMIPGKAQQHPEHIIENTESNGIDVLKTALLYGANASGKSNLIQAMAFAKDFIVEGVRPKAQIQVTPFKLDDARRKEPSKFEFEFIVQGKAYAYGFSVDRERVYEEWLYSVDSEHEASLFERKTDDALKTNVVFSETIGADGDELQFLNYVARSTRYNQLFLTKSADDEIETFDKFREWFDAALKIIFPQAHHSIAEIDILDNDVYRDALSQFLREMNTGIEYVYTKKYNVNLDSNAVQQNKEVAQILDYLVTDNENLVMGKDGNRFVYRRNEDNQPEIYLLKTKHQNSDTSDAIFDISEESDGTQRLVDLFSVLHSDTTQVLIVDELERSLHPNLVRKLLEWYLMNNRASQLIVTTHESTLLDLDLLRRDEIWFVEKDKSGNSTLYSLEEFKPRADLDIRKGYLHGRYGAIPVIGSSLNLSGDIAHAA